MSGAQRIHDPEFLIQRMKECGIEPASMQGYIDAFNLGAPPHAGGGIGKPSALPLHLVNPVANDSPVNRPRACRHVVPQARKHPTGVIVPARPQEAEPLDKKSLCTATSNGYYDGIMTCMESGRLPILCVSLEARFVRRRLQDCQLRCMPSSRPQVFLSSSCVASLSKTSVYPGDKLQLGLIYMC